MSWLTDWRNVILTGKPPRGDILPTDKHRVEKDVEEKWCKVARSHVHDEIVALVKTKLAEISASTLEEQMIEKPKWWGEDVPIRAKADIVKEYQK